MSTTALQNSRHEHFVQMLVRGEIPAQAYVSAGYSQAGADQSASRLLKNAQIRARIAHLRAEVAQNLLAETIREKQFRLDLLERRRNLLEEIRQARAQEYVGIEELSRIIDPATGIAPPEAWESWRARYPFLAFGRKNTSIHVADLIYTGTPAGKTGLMLRDYRGRNADRVIFKVDTGMLAELRAIEKQAAEEVGDVAAGGAIGGITVQLNVAFVQPAA